ncbi:hypothetical protein ASD15_24385 [Massilia sp. Root351]|jgi:UDP-2,4-diacetamido-2,4,6-trideoxy-beta-L-altropyranose hydrolase|uniref:UDP-2,4-diacetamido-2,4, 6-trideoxy-beta-L-altropyranose hydrolase n=1 Tax=Massilia sp. Root351 TaxID=1736522 RepID=UPI0007093774|nr:UDP-2,4-diacetamido-2,4,6-trideoxy-beta-L-altropyranose hydrolase [Massilia sp. Root351]KQV89848.1 hypothetical protein ASD15_24385 [Massilia sp. Root351]
MKVVIRCDAAPAIGTGHVVRCLTLAERLRAGGAQVRFICRAHPGHMAGAIAARGFAVGLLPAPAAANPAPAQAEPPAPAHAAWLGAGWQQDAADTLAAMAEGGDARPDWLIVDHYGIDAAWQRAVRPAVQRLMVIDDLADRPHDCDLLLDQNLADAGAARYAGLVPPHCQLLCGPRYALLRDEFAQARAALAPRSGRLQRLLVFIGGADLHDETGRVLDALAELHAAGQPLAADVVVGAAYAAHEALAARCAALPGVRLHRQVSNMAELMAGADLAIGAGGGAMWERCSVGLPAIVLAVAGNQRPGCEAMGRAGAALYVGGPGPDSGARLLAALRLACASPWLLQHLAAASLALVDGQGAARVARRLAALPLAAGLRLRPAAAADCDAVWAWRNDDTVRRHSGDSAALPLAAHRQWYAGVLADPERQLLLAEIGAEVAGVLRYDRKQNQATISVYLTPAFLGKGIGPALLEQGSAWVARHWAGVDTIEALVRPQNLASAEAFATAGFSLEFDIYRLRIKP